MIKVRNLATVMAAGALIALAGCSALGLGGSESQQAVATPAPAAAPPAPAATPEPLPASELTPQMLRRVQADLKREGLYHGRIDGKWGPMTQSAVMQFQQKHSLQATGSLDEPTLQAMNIAPPNMGAMSNMPAGNSTATGAGTAGTTEAQPKNP
ncbi:MAG: peptidoglycan-binding domain-containing protein [Acetobacteraceae bacterium]